MNKVKVRIWDRDFELNVAYQNFPGEEVTQNQKVTLDKVVDTDFSEAKKGVEQYIRKYSETELGEDGIDNIFRYVMPKSILITRNEDTHIFAIMCNYKFDMEHGIAVVFENEKFKAAESQDLIL